MSDETIRFAIHRLKDAVVLLAEACHTERGIWQMYECYFKVEDNGVYIDDIVFKKADKNCRRIVPRLMVNGKRRM